MMGDIQVIKVKKTGTTTKTRRHGRQSLIREDAIDDPKAEFENDVDKGDDKEGDDDAEDKGEEEAPTSKMQREKRKLLRTCQLHSSRIQRIHQQQQKK